jgi:hypothetical protein
MSQEPSAIPESFGPNLNDFAWPDIFYSMLATPSQTLRFLADTQTNAPSYGVLSGAFLTFILSALCKGFSQVSLASPHPYLSVIASLVGDLFLLSTLCIFLTILAGFLKIKTTFTSILVVTSWAFIPAIFQAPISCFLNLSKTWGFLSDLSTLWFCLLQFFAFEAVLKVGRLNTISLIAITPPLFFFVLIFWSILALVSILLAVLSAFGIS